MGKMSGRQWEKSMLRTSWLYGLLGLTALAAAALCRAFALSAQAMAFARMFPWLFLGGGGVFLFLSKRMPRAGSSEYYRIFQFLYHSGLLILTAASFLIGMCAGKEGISSDIRLTVIAGGALLCAGVIVLSLIAWEQSEKNDTNKCD